MHDMATALCPTCGTARTGSFRYCRSCGLDFDADTPGASAPGPAILGSLPDASPLAQPADRSAAGAAQPAGDVIVIQKRHLKLLAAIIVSGLIGIMLAGAVVVPFFGETGLLLGSVAGILTVIVSVWLGLRFLRLTSRRG